MKKYRGFTLIELMIVVAVMSILLMVALPSYNQYVTKVNRSDAKAALAEVSQRLESYYADNNKYPNNIKSLKLEDVGYPLISGFYNTKEGLYQLKYSRRNNGKAFLLSTFPYGGQKSRENKLDESIRCIEFTLDEKGDKGMNPSTLNAKKCWR